MIFRNRVLRTLAERDLYHAAGFFKINNNARLNSLIHQRCFSILEDKAKLSLKDHVSLLRHLGDIKDVKRGMSVHSCSIKIGFETNVFFQNNLLRFYGVSGDISSAQALFDEMGERNLVTWTSMVSAYVNYGQYENALKMFCIMLKSGLKANEFSFSVALKACRLTDSAMGLLIHGHLVKCGFESCHFCSASVLGFYAEQEDVKVARRVFDSTPVWAKSEALWNTLLNIYVAISDVQEAVGLYNHMIFSSVSPNSITFSIILKLFANVSEMDLARSFHGHILKLGFGAHDVVGGALVNVYSKMGVLDDAFCVFYGLEAKDNLAWSALLAGFNKTGLSDQGLGFYFKFRSEGNKPDVLMYATVLSLCSCTEYIDIGKQVHCLCVKDGFEKDSLLGSALIKMYGGQGMVFDSYQCFLEVEQIVEICFGCIMKILLINSYQKQVLELFTDMMQLELAPSHSIASYALRACTSIGIPREGRSVHCYIIKSLFNGDFSMQVGNALIEMYAKSMDFNTMRNVFSFMNAQNEFSWTAVISGLSESGLFMEALQMFKDMVYSSESSKPSEYTMVAVFQACTKSPALEMGKQCHGYVTKVGFDSSPFVQSALINMYAAFKKEIQNAFLVFSCAANRDHVSWSAMVTAWAHNGYDREALELFTEFRGSPEFQLDESILTSCISSSADLAAPVMGMSFQAYTIKTGFTFHSYVTSSIIDMYSKCGKIEDARKFFDQCVNHNLVCWTAMISGYAYNGLGNEAVDVFLEMKKDPYFKPDGVTFLGILTACSHAGLVKEGWEFFKTMKYDYGLEASVNHYASMVDLLGRAEEVDEAEELINGAPFDTKSKILLLKTLLGACNKYGNLLSGRRIGQKVLRLEPNDPSNYVMLSNIYASADMWEDSMEVRNKLRVKHVNKEPGFSWIQVEN